jgi:hypothetical protein
VGLGGGEEASRERPGVEAPIARDELAAQRALGHPHPSTPPSRCGALIDAARGEPAQAQALTREGPRGTFAGPGSASCVVERCFALGSSGMKRFIAASDKGRGCDGRLRAENTAVGVSRSLSVFANSD